jgi:CubicO group peptidase (beta-lactamase class C family)
MNMDFLDDLDKYIKIKQYRLINSVLAYRDNELVYERYFNKGGINARNQIKSIWKSIISVTLGICLYKGLIKSIDEPVGSYLPQFAKGIYPYHQSISVGHLLTMSSGIYWNGGIHYHCPMLAQMRRSKDWIAHIAEVRPADYPGTKFVYKEWDAILLSALIGRICGGSAWDICHEYLYKPLEITGERWSQSVCGVDYPSYGNDKTDALSARDTAKIGLLMLNGGIWDGHRVLSEEYIKSSISPSPASGAYGRLWWLSEKGFHGRGFGGQELNIYPGKNIVAVVQAAVTPSGRSYQDICANIVK